MLQCEEENYQSVSFKPNVHELLDSASEQKLPVKIHGFKRKANYKDNNLTDIEINRATSVIPLAQADFAYKEIEIDIAGYKDIQSVIADG